MEDVLGKLGIELIWFDSLGAKSSCTYIKSSSGGVIIDPGVAAMQPSYPLPDEAKEELRLRALSRIEAFCIKARYIVITHYHYDHHTLPSNFRNSMKAYLNGKVILLKNPNKYINESQWNRAREFLRELLSLGGTRLEEYLEEPRENVFEDPVNKLVLALSMDFGDYNKRRKELLSKGRKWFENLVNNLWSSKYWIMDNITLRDGTRILFCDGRYIDLGDTILKFLNPFFHGIEYDRTGWVIPILIIKGNYRIFYTSDLMGPQIEDYAHIIVKEKPDVIIADGPPTYLYPYMLNRINFQRAINNMKYIIENSKPKLIIYDHHLLREKRWRLRVSEVFSYAKKYGVNLLTAAEYLGTRPLIDTL